MRLSQADQTPSTDHTCENKRSFGGERDKQQINHVNEWFKLKYGKLILNTVCGYSVGLNGFGKHKYIPYLIKFSNLKHHQIENKLQRFLDCGIIIKVQKSDPDEFISNSLPDPNRM